MTMLTSLRWGVLGAMLALAGFAAGLGLSAPAAAFTNLVILTDTPAALATALINRGVMVLDAQNNLVGAREGVEWVEVPNPVVATPASGTLGDPGYVPAVMDSRRAFMVKLVRAAEDDEISGRAQTQADGSLREIAVRTKLGAWVATNSVANTTNGIRVRRVTLPNGGGTVDLVLNVDAPLLGAWQ